MNTNIKTVMTIKTDKSLRDSARMVTDELGIPLGTAINAFLRQLVRERGLHLSSTLQPTTYLQSVIVTAEAEYAAGKTRSADGVSALFAALNK
jgi:addiction module RelB/DinJ family antitoxin